MMGRFALVCMAMLAARVAQAHGIAGEAPGPAWMFDPWVTTPLLLSAGLYLDGTTALWRRAGLGRGIRRWQASAYAVGWLALAGALLSPLHWLGEHLFTAHMIEHEIVMAVAAPLIALSRPVGAYLWAVPPGLRQAIGGVARGRAWRALWAAMTRPVTATVLHGVAIWAWHVPPLFDAALTDLVLHRLQHLSFLLTALLFWWALLRRCSLGSAVLHLFVTMMHTSILGALITLAPHVRYGAQTAGAARWGLTPLEDQQLAGLVMWVPAGTVYAGAALAFLALWIKRSGASWKGGYALPLA